MRFIVDTYLPFDTGGTEAMVQLAISLRHTVPAPHEACIWRRRLHPRFYDEYPNITNVPTVHMKEVLESNETRPGDVIIAPDVRSNWCGPQIARQPGVVLYLYVLSSVNLRRLSYYSAKYPGRCRFLYHSWRLHNLSRAEDDPNSSLPLRPYISPSIVAYCRANRLCQSRSGSESERAHCAEALALPPHLGSTELPRRPLVLLDSDTTNEIRYFANRACNHSACDVVRVTRKSRKEVKALLLSASIVVDWCMVGTERLPVEAALCGAVILTSSCEQGGGADTRDFPMPARNVLRHPSELVVAITRVLQNLRTERDAQLELVDLYDTGTSAYTLDLEVDRAVATMMRLHGDQSRTADLAL